MARRFEKVLEGVNEPSLVRADRDNATSSWETDWSHGVAGPTEPGIEDFDWPFG